MPRGVMGLLALNQMEVERPGRVGSGPYLLKLWQEGTTRMVTFSGVTFP